jgi:uncharacterized membrane protein
VRENRRILAVAVLAVLLTGYAMTDSQKDATRRTASGAGIGIAAGALVGELATGQPLHDAAIGAAAGAIGKWLYDRHKEAETLGY